MKRNSITIGTRGSELALWQTNFISQSLKQLHPSLHIDITTIKTTGDKILDSPLSKIGDKGLFTKELDRALLAGTIDLAVHSLKDIPTQLTEGLCIAAVTQREDVRDVFIPHPAYKGAELKDVPPGAEIATGSLRRRSMLLHNRPDVKIIDVRGNLNTRIEKLKNSTWHGMLLAYAGVVRLGWKDLIGEILPTSQFLPAVGQGALGIVIRSNDEELSSLVKLLNHEPTYYAAHAERALLRHLEGGCQIPIGALGTVEGKTMTLDALVGDIRGTKIIRDSISGNCEECEQIGVQLANQLLAQGADVILNDIRKTAKTTS